MIDPHMRTSFFLAFAALPLAGIVGTGSCSWGAPPAAVVQSPSASVAPMRALIIAGDAGAASTARDLCVAAKLETEISAPKDEVKDIVLANLLRHRLAVLAGVKAETLSARQRMALESFVQSGGGLVVMGGTSGDWHWLGRLTGRIGSPLPDPKEPRPPLKRAFDGGRGCFVPETAEGFADAAGRAGTEGCIRYAARLGEPAFALDPESRRPTDDYFKIEELATGLEDPMEIAPLPDGRVLILERLGAVKLYAPGRGVRLLTQLKLQTMRPGDPWYDGGGMGIAVDPDFGVKNDFVYIYYSTPDRLTDPKMPRTDAQGPDVQKGEVNRLSRFRLVNGETLADEVPLLDVAEDRYAKECHQGGSLTFGKNRELFLSSGDNTNPFVSDCYAPIDERPGRFRFDAQRSSGNTNDLRGGISRIRINEAGDGYTIPNGNLFKPGTPKTRPELFVKGCRNPWRIAYDSKTGGIAWGDVGPDAGGTNDARGPIGYDLIGLATKAGYYGWPYARGPVKSWKNVHNAFYTRYDFATGKTAECFADGIRNTSPNNTGLVDLPAPEQPLVWYTYGYLPEFPEMGGGGRCAAVSVVYNQEGRTRTLPKWFDHVLISHDWTRARFDLVKVGKDGQVESIQPWLRGSLPKSLPSDMAQDKDGSLYLLEYGGGWTGNKNGRLVKISFQGWKREPIITLDEAERFGGLSTQFAFDAQVNTAEDKPYTARWDFGDGTTAEGLKATHAYTQPGRFEAKLTVTDADGVSATRKVAVSAGNTYPTLSVGFKDAPKTIPWGGELKLNVKADDAEDGDLSSSVVLTAQFGVPFNGPQLDPRLTGLNPSLRGAQLMVSNGCIACHSALSTVAGPAYADVAKRYKDDPLRLAKLTESITKGSTGKWNAHMAMPPFSSLPAQDVADLVAAIGTLANPSSVALTVDNGVVKLPKERPAGIPANAVLTVRAQVTDKGAKGLAPLTSSTTATFVEAAANAGVRIAAGDGTVMDSDGGKWEAEQQYAKGGYGYSGGAVFKADGVTDPLAKSARYGDIRYTFDAADGDYDVTCVVSEPYYRQEGQRVFSVLCNKDVLFKDLDPFKEAGFGKTARRTSRVHVTGGRLELTFAASANLPLVNAIEVTPVSKN
jgi:cytochrome c